jgi:predicted phosphodiesterase
MADRIKVVKDFIAKFSGLSHNQIARKLFDEYPTLFKDVEAARTLIRYYSGKKGGYSRTSSKIKLHQETMQQAKQSPDVLKRWGLQKSKGNKRKTFQIPAEHDRVLWISDIHIPNHDEEALTAALEYGIENKANCIVIGGDLIDNAPFTRFRVPPDKKRAKEYFDMATDFLAALRKNFPKALIIYMEGNHDRWYTDWLIDHCAVVFDDAHYHLETRLKLDSFNIQFIKENVMVKAGKLPMLHGHTVVRGVFAPVNAARGAYIRSKHNLLIGHTHQVSMHSEKDITGKVTKTWSTGCLCTLSPDYDPHNTKHGHGFAFITTDKTGAFTVNNFEIVDGVIR